MCFECSCISLLKTAKSFSHSKLAEIQEHSKHIVYCNKLTHSQYTKSIKLSDINITSFECSCISASLE